MAVDGYGPSCGGYNFCRVGAWNLGPKSLPPVAFCSPFIINVLRVSLKHLPLTAVSHDLPLTLTRWMMGRLSAPQPFVVPVSRLDTM